jgi:gluconate 2-dehydrogenase gamma chain
MGSVRLTATQRTTLEAIGERLVPTDEHGPGAVACGAVDYVGQALAGDYADLMPAYVAGLRALDARARAREGHAFADCTPDAQDALLSETETSADPAFFELVRRHVFEGMFGDPSYGGNRDGAGWELLGYPGPRAVWTEEDQRIGEVAS